MVIEIFKENKSKQRNIKECCLSEYHMQNQEVMKHCGL